MRTIAVPADLLERLVRGYHGEQVQRGTPEAWRDWPGIVAVEPATFWVGSCTDADKRAGEALLAESKVHA